MTTRAWVAGCVFSVLGLAACVTGVPEGEDGDEGDVTCREVSEDAAVCSDGELACYEGVEGAVCVQGEPSDDMQCVREAEDLVVCSEPAAEDGVARQAVVGDGPSVFQPPDSGSGGSGGGGGGSVSGQVLPPVCLECVRCIVAGSFCAAYSCALCALALS